MKYSFFFYLLVAFPISLISQGNCLDFDGVDDYVSLGDITELNQTSQFTVETWIFFTGYSNFATIFEKRETGFSNITLQTDSNSSSAGNNDFTVGVTSQQSDLAIGKTGGDIIDLNQWFHIAMVFDGSQSTNSTRLKLYKNGIQQTLTFSDSIPIITPTINSDATLGREPINLRFPFKGRLDELRVWGIAKTEGQILNSMTCTLSGTEDNLIAYYRFDEGIAASDNTGKIELPDLSGNAHNGILTEFALTGSNSNWLASGASTIEYCASTIDTCLNPLMEVDMDLFITQASKGLILVSPNGDKWKLTIDNNGSIISTKLTNCDN